MTKSRIMILGLAGLLVVGGICVVGYHSLIWALRTGPSSGPSPPGQAMVEAAAEQAARQGNTQESVQTAPLPLKPVPRLTREEALGLAVFSLYPDQRKLLPQWGKGSVGSIDMAVDRAGPPARVDANLLPQLRALGSTPGLPGNGTGLVLMLGHVGQEPEVRLVDEAIKAYTRRCIADDPDGRHRLEAWMQALAILAGRQVAGAQELHSWLVTPEGWAALEICDCSIVERPETGGDLVVDLSRRQLAAGIAAGVPGLQPAAEYALETYAARNGYDKKYETFFVQSIRLASYVRPAVSAQATAKKQADAQDDRPAVLDVLQANFKRHTDAVTLALESPVDYQQGLLSTLPGKSRQ